jgi:acyl-CoA thioesterase FadM
VAIVSKWPVRIRVAVRDDEVDAENHLTEAGAQRAFSEARGAYLDGCESLSGRDVSVRTCDVKLGTATVRTGVVVATGVVEIFPDSFTMHARIRSDDDGELAADGVCELTTGEELPIECRDEFIARAHRAAYTI